ncbi:ABC transporter ATP-binding protein [Ancylobacter mangrovi]|nr:ABC transporter ATP-binding protein [Ancylobacter mangrovi]MCS0502168.1 ABC transporter ATP-binding protein [Ancylobacter mangrovi]
MDYTGRSGRVTRALDGIDASVGRDEFVTLLGPSGCGKSTLMKIAASVVRATGGEVLFEGRPLAKPTSRIGMVFQQPILMPWRSVLDNVLFPIEMMGRSPRKHAEQARELLELVGLKGFESAMPSELSGGMQQRVAICRALIYDPVLLMMDEPFAALDAMTREDLGIELLRIWSERRKTVLFVTHSIQEGILLADRVLVMTARPGRIAASIPITLPRPRGMDMVSTDEYGRYAQQIRSIIAGAGH